ncbi:MAG: hypothetical protein WA421_02080 [Nitrososphaeraceae archaeon]
MYQVDYRDTGLPLETIRSVSKVSDGIEVTVSVSAPQTMRYDGLNLADIKDPANNKSVFQARYQVWWKEPTKGFESLGGVLYSGPASCFRGSGRLDVFVKAIAGDIDHKWFQNGWSNWLADS